jgi:cobaltochelatase CobT
MKINPRVIVVREAISRIVPILVGRGVKVTQAGSKAYVTWKKDNTAERVNLPYLPDDAEDGLITAVMGFLDHECAHILFTDPKASAEAARDKFHDKLWNPIEDTFIERKMASRFTGSAFNMRAAAQLYLTDRVERELKDHPEAKLNLLLVPAFRAWAGQDQFVEFMKDKWHLIEDFTATVGADMIAKMPHIESSWDSLEVAREIYKRLKAADEPKEKKEKPKAAPPEEDDSDIRDEGGTPTSDEDMDWEDDESPTGGTGGSDDSEGEDDSSSDDDSDTERDSGSDDGSEDDGSTSGAGAGVDVGEDDGEGSGTDSESEEPAAAGSDKDVGGRSDDLHAEDEGEDEGGVSGSGTDGPEPDAGEDEEADKPAGMGASEFHDVMKRSEDFDDEVASAISKRMEDSKSPYLIYTKDHDQVIPIEDSECPAHYVKSLEDKVDHMIAPMQKDLERAIAARSATIWTGGHKSGRLHGSALVRLFGMGDRIDVFRRKQENSSKSVAVSLVVDCSGSMTMGGKISLACHAAYGLSATLERIGINHEVIGFTTDSLPYDAIREMHSDPNYRKFARSEALLLPIFKDYHERLTANVVRRFALCANQRQSFGMSENVDGESVQIAAHRLSVRSETRKIMIVLSDGEPACASPAGDRLLDAHLKESVKNIEKSGIDVVGIGIMSSAVKKFYTKNVVISDIKQLPVEVLRQLKALLLK